MNKEIKKKLVRFENYPFVLLSTQELWDNERKMKLDRLIKVEKGLPVGKKNAWDFGRFARQIRREREKTLNAKLSGNKNGAEVRAGVATLQDSIKKGWVDLVDVKIRNWNWAPKEIYQDREIKISLITWNYSSEITPMQETMESHSLKAAQNESSQEITPWRQNTCSKWLHNIWADLRGIEKKIPVGNYQSNHLQARNAIYGDIVLCLIEYILGMCGVRVIES